MPALMTPPLAPHSAPEPPRFDGWPPAVISAAVLRGTLVRCGPGVRGIGWPETPRVRALALAPWLSRRRIAVHLTAAWVWGAARSPGHPLTVSMPNGHREGPGTRPDRVTLHLRCGPEDIEGFGPCAVTTPLRTLVDLLHAGDALSRHRAVACRLLVPLVPGGVDAVRARLASRRRPHRRAATERLARLLGS